MNDSHFPPEVDASPVTPEGDGSSGGPINTVWQAFLDPAAAFRSLAQRPTWIWALVVMVLVSLATQVVVSRHMDIEEVVRRSIAERQQDGAELTEAQMDQAIRAATVFGRVAMMSAPVVVPAIFALLAGIYLGLLRLVGSEVSFRSMFATVLHATLPAAVVSSLLTMVVVSQRGGVVPDDRSGLLRSSLAALLPEGTAAPLATLASIVDIFNIWQWVLLVMGFVVVARVRRGQAVTVVAVAWIAWAVLRVGMAFLRP